MAHEDLAALEEVVDRCGNADLSRLAAKLRDARVERLGAAFQCIDGKRASGERGGEDSLSIEECVERERSRCLRTVDECEALLRTKLELVEADTHQRLARRHKLTGNVDPAVSHQGRDEVG